MRNCKTGGEISHTSPGHIFGMAFTRQSKQNGGLVEDIWYQCDIRIVSSKEEELKWVDDKVIRASLMSEITASFTRRPNIHCARTPCQRGALAIHLQRRHALRQLNVTEISTPDGAAGRYRFPLAAFDVYPTTDCSEFPRIGGQDEVRVLGVQDNGSIEVVPMLAVSEGRCDRQHLRWF